MVYKTSISFTTEQAINSLTVKEEDYSEVFYAPFANETTLLTMRFAFSGSDGSYTATFSQIPGTEWDGGANVYVSAPGYRPTNMTTIANTGSLIPKNYVYPVNQLYISNNCYYNCQNITSVDLNNIPWTNNSMVYAFENCSNLTTILNINQNVTNMYCAFDNCTNLVDAPVIPNSVTDMSSTFSDCRNLVSILDMSNSNRVTNMFNTFYECYNLSNVPSLPPNVIDLGWTFYRCNRLVNAPSIPNSVTNMYQTFLQCTNLLNVPSIPNSVTNIAYAFYICSNLVNAPNMINAYSLQNMTGTFSQCFNLQGNVYIGSENIENATNCFYPTALTKNVYIPFKYANNVNTATYNAFIDAGYKIDGSVNGVYLKDLNQDYVTLTVNPTPSDAQVVLATSDAFYPDRTIVNSNSITVPANTVVDWSARKDGYKIKGGKTTVSTDTTIYVSLESRTVLPYLEYIVEGKIRDIVYRYFRDSSIDVPGATNPYAWTSDSSTTIVYTPSESVSVGDPILTSPTATPPSNYSVSAVGYEDPTEDPLQYCFIDSDGNYCYFEVNPCNWEPIEI